VLISTSGSAGKPKIVFLTWESLFWNARAANERVRVGVGDMWFVDLPLWHVSGLCAMVRALEAGATVCLAGGPEEQATHRSCVPTQLRRWLDSGRTPGMLRELLVGGASMPAGMRIEASQKGWPARATYGLTEAGSQVCTGEKVGMPGEDLVSCGKPLEGWEIRLIDGEIWIRGKGLFAGYVKPEGDVVSEKCEGGWFATGDVGEWNERGELRVLGRRDRMILCAGEKVYPERIEAELKALKGIRQVFALGVEDREYGQRVVVFVDGEGEVGRWKEYLRERVSGLEMPVRWYRWPVENVLQDSSAGTMKPQGKFFEELLARGTVGTYKLEEIG
ncbi:MAG: AMP-binding protein, partial [Chthoniobacterales bacterium]|nr:AMP-binding protein [Chthoniobacterales bacterium]